DTVPALARHTRPLLQIRERRLPRSQMRLAHRVTDIVTAERVQEADALRRREHQVVAGHRRQRLHLDPTLTRSPVDPLHRDLPPGRMAAKLGGRERMLPSDPPPELALTHDPVQLELSRTAPHPNPRRLTPTRVVVLDPVSDRTLVIRLLARR